MTRSASYLPSMPAVTLPELQTLETGDVVYAVILYQDHDGSRSIYFAGRTTVTVYDYPSGERSYSPDACSELDFSELDFSSGTFVTEDWRCFFSLDAESARAELESMKSSIRAFADKELAGLDVAFAD